MRTGAARPAFGVLFAAIVAMALPAGAFAAPGWLAPKALSTAGEDAFGPRVGVDSEGDAVAVWEVSSGADEMIQSASRPAGGSWSPPVDISAIGGDAEDPEVAIDPQGDAVATWTSVEGSEKVIEAASRPAGGNWSAAVGISPGGALATRAQVALDAHGDAVAIWQYYAGSEEVIQSATRLAGSTWSAPVDVSVTGSGVSFPTIGLDADGDAVAVWIYYDGTNEILESASRPAGGSWSPSLGISAPGEDPEDLSLEVDPQGDAVAVWENYIGPPALVVGAFRPAGGSWSPAGDISPIGEVAFEPAVAIDATGKAVAVWIAEDGTEYIARSAARPRGGPWSPPLDLSAPAADVLDPAVAVGPQGDAVAAWSIADGMSSVLQGATMPAQGSWSAPAELSGTAARFDRPDVAADAQGDAAAVWWGSDGTDEIVQAAGYEAAPPQLRSLSVPASGTVGQTLSFAVSPFDVWSALGPVDWSFGDGAGAAGSAVAHAYTSAGTYTVSVGAADALGNSSGASGTVTITPAVGTATGKGRAKVARLAWVRHGRAQLRMSCPGPDRCAGVVRLSVAAKPKKDRIRRRASKLLIGRAAFAIAAGKKKTVRVKLSGEGRARVRAAVPGGLRSRLGGTGVEAASVVLREHRRRRAGR